MPTARKRVRSHGAGTGAAGYSPHREMVIYLLNASLATEILCVLRYRSHHFKATSIHADGMAREFLEHSNEEQRHADKIAERIVQLGGVPNFAPDGLVGRSQVEYVEGMTLDGMIKENLVAERLAIDSYRNFIKYLGARDQTTRRMMERILATEESHAGELAGWHERFAEKPAPKMGSVKPKPKPKPK